MVMRRQGGAAAHPSTRDPAADGPAPLAAAPPPVATAAPCARAAAPPAAVCCAGPRAPPVGGAPPRRLWALPYSPAAGRCLRAGDDIAFRRRARRGAKPAVFEAHYRPADPVFT